MQLQMDRQIQQTESVTNPESTVVRFNDLVVEGKRDILLGEYSNAEDFKQAWQVYDKFIGDLLKINFDSENTRAKYLQAFVRNKGKKEVEIMNADFDILSLSRNQVLNEIQKQINGLSSSIRTTEAMSNLTTNELQLFEEITSTVNTWIGSLKQAGIINMKALNNNNFPEIEWELKMLGMRKKSIEDAFNKLVNLGIIGREIQFNQFETHIKELAA